MNTPNSFQQVVAADDATARKALSELGGAPLPPVAELEAALGIALKLSEALSELDAMDWADAVILVNKLRRRIDSARRATGGNDKIRHDADSAAPQPKEHSNEL